MFRKSGNDQLKKSSPSSYKKDITNALSHEGEEPAYIWCLVGNIVEEQVYGMEKERRHGTKNFSPGTKVYCFNTEWGDGYENIRVIGRHKVIKRNVCIIIRAKHITNWRLQKVYRPYVLKVMQSHYRGWTNSDRDKADIMEMALWLNNRR